MIGITVIASIIYSFLIKYSLSVDLILPLSESDAAQFQVRKDFVSQRRGDEYIFNLISYESRPNDLIRRVVYHGVELINDREDHPEGFRRFVLYGTWNNTVVMGISKKQSGITTPERVFGFNRDNIRNFMQSPSVQSFVRDHPDTLIGSLLTSIFYGTQPSNKRKYDELDSVDDEAYLVRGNTDVSSKEIEKQVEVVIQNKSSTQTDPSLPGPSGLKPNSGHSLKLKREQISEEESDSD